MPSLPIKCGYCKKGTSAHNYGKHLLSKGHLQEFIAENKFQLQQIAKSARTTAIQKFFINENPACICIVCKTYYIDNDTLTETQSSADKHFEKYPACKEGTINAVKALLEIKKSKASNGEIEKLQKEIKRLKYENDGLQCMVDEGEEISDRVSKYGKWLISILGNGDDRHLEDRFEYFKDKGVFPLPL